MKRNKTFHKKKIMVLLAAFCILLCGLIVRLVCLMIFQADYYEEKAQQLHEREREIKAARGKILDAKGLVLAANRTVCTISVIHSQLREPEKVIDMLVRELGIDEARARRRVEKVSSIERVQTNVEKEIGDRIRGYGLAGVKVDEDFKRDYPFDTLASKVLGFTGADNQGIIGLEVVYDSVLEGINGRILTMTDARGVELDGAGESRVEAVSGYNLQTSLDSNIQLYAQQAAQRVMEEKQADAVSIIVMNPQNGEIMAMVNIPEFSLNDPFALPDDVSGLSGNASAPSDGVSGLSDKEKQERLNQMWRNDAINDTYEPGSTFKIFTMTAGLEAGVVSLSDTFHCGGYRIVEDRRIHCHKRIGHGAETFLQGAENSCNPVFIDVGLRLGVDQFYRYFRQVGLMDKTGIDLPGEASTIMHKKENVGEVELATMSFGQSFQITPIQLAATVSSIINGGTRIVPHFGVDVEDDEGRVIQILEYPEKKGIVSAETAETVRYILEHVVSEGSGRNASIEGYAIGGKTATSQTLPRSANRYISSFVGFAPADNPQVLGMCVIHDPQGVYYGGTIAAPVIRDIFANILPYLDIEKQTGKTGAKENMENAVE